MRTDARLPLIPFLSFGLLIGFVGRMLVAGRGAGWTASMLVGAAGSMVGAGVARLDHLQVSGEPRGFALSLVGAFALVALCHAVAARRRPA